jgi:hypothetical protein
MRPIIIRPAAEADLVAAREWHKQKRLGLGDPKPTTNRQKAE